MQLSRIVLIGRLTRDPEERHTGDGLELSKFCVAVNRMGKPDDGKPPADFFNVVCFRQTAKFVNAYLRKGALVAVDGRLTMDEYTDRDGAKRLWVEVQADNVQNLTPKADAGEEAPRAKGPYLKPYPPGYGDTEYRGGAEVPDRDFADDDPGPRRKAEPMARGGRRSFDDDGEDPFASE